MHHSFHNRAFHLILLLFVSLRLSSAETTSAELRPSVSSHSSASSSSSCDPSSKSCSTHSQETETRIQQLKDSSPTQVPVDPPTIDDDESRNETDSQNGINGSRTASPAGQAGSPNNSNGSSFHLRLPSLKLPQRDFFSITDRINALRNLFQSIINLDRELLWNPIVPSRMSRGSFLVKLFSKLLKIMPFHEVSGAASPAFEAPVRRLRDYAK